MLDDPKDAKGPPMSRFKNEIEHLKAHIQTLRLGAGLLFGLAVAMGIGWWSSPRDLTIHVPPDLRSGSTRKWWDVPPENVYAFAWYVWQQLQRWPVNGEEDYTKNIRSLSAYLTPGCKAFLQDDYSVRMKAGELRQRTRGIYELPGRSYGSAPTLRVKTISDRDWIVTLDVEANEYFGSEPVKRALIRYPLKVVRSDIDPEKNPFGLVIDCFDGAPERIALPEAAASSPSKPGMTP
jgi:integrating conjugative element protein (TIGR03746 family)